MATYVIKKGDTPWSIAQRNGISLDELSKANNNMDVNKTIYAGQTLNIPTAGGANGTGTVKTPSTQNGNAVAQMGQQNKTTTAPQSPQWNYQMSDTIKDELDKKEAADQAVKNMEPFKYANQSQLDGMIDQILNRPAFKYDLNGDVLYNQYKDQFQALGRTAMADTMGQAAAMTGGYGNSYATSVGAQAYQSYLQQLNDKIPELYSLALNQYNQEGDRLLQNYDLLSRERDQAQEEWSDRYNRALTERDYHQALYDNAYAREYADYQNKFNTAYQNARDAVADQQYAEKLAYTKEQDAIANAINKAQLDETIRANKADEQYRREALLAEQSGKEQEPVITDDEIKALVENGQYVEALNVLAERYGDLDTVRTKALALGIKPEQITLAETGEITSYGQLLNELGWQNTPEWYNATANKILKEEEFERDESAIRKYGDYQNYLTQMYKKYTLLK